MTSRTASYTRDYGVATVLFPAVNLMGTATIPGAYPMPLADQPDVAIGLVASNTWNGEPAAKAVAWVKWGAGNTSFPSGQPEQGKFRKPLIFVEGIDFGCDQHMKSFCYSIQPKQTGILSRQFLIDLSAVDHSTFRNGSVGWNEMVQYSAENEAVEKLPNLYRQLISQGYDLIFLDYSDGSTYIQSNAMTLVELLQYVNSHRTADAEETIVTAASMGGQVARFALAYMEQNSLCHNAKMYVSIDSPHRGANIPLGIQCLIGRLRDTFLGVGFKPQLEDLQRPAAQQMLIYHVSDDATWRRQMWQTWQQSPDSYPTHLRKIAIADGNRTGQILQTANGGSQFGGNQLLWTTWQAQYGLYTLDWGENYVNSLPGASSRGHDNVIFRYRKPFHTSWEYTTVPSGTPNYDLAPGGTRHTTYDAQKDGNGLLASGSDYQTFIPTISALDVSAAGNIYSADVFYNVASNINPLRPNTSKYAFDAYFAPDGISEPHINITNGQPHEHQHDPPIPDYSSNNSAWLLNELAESAHGLPATLTTTYNYGSLYRLLLPSVTVGSGGQLFVNNASLPNSGGTAATANTQKEAAFEVYTSSCGSRVQVNGGGALTLGQPNDPNKATVRIGNLSLLDLRSGGQTVVNAGSTLRIEKGGTLLLRAGSTLSVLGTVVLDQGAYVCIEDPNSVVTGAGGQFTAAAGFLRGTNPALGLDQGASPPNCNPNYPPCTPTLNLQVTTNDGLGREASNADGDAETNFDKEKCTRVFIVTAVGEGLGTTFSWQVNGTTVASRPGHPDQIQLALNVNNPSRQVSVTVNNTCNAQLLSTSSTVTGWFPTCTQGQRAAAVTMYPNPAGGALHFERPPSADPAAPAPAEYEVSLYDGQGRLRWQGRSSGGQLHLASGSLPRGIYGVVITQGDSITRRNLSLE